MSKNTGRSKVAVPRSARKPWYDIIALTAGGTLFSAVSVLVKELKTPLPADI